ncbi:catalase A [Ophidiomyces ophidiicola]|uniref:Catalase A n=1 Tax=Ophidiomyces ophidiicola TaxID=1387563 RepID=A0ACB8UTI5_9EURO|nr:catalase A [Ophidiomyces ophidiicola]KAI1906829.1 catalase A [Ophidiomyces ophidiicola]KAI1907616.1 catalase A [Ophidiomyces ophidiicola]KAI1922878.1 catalase A [Ophidiomyces ophidiicola]KAI1939839.1 catalase A [Ophidiomyces ophidiicola]KAI1951978.1 catalase A [Ophidiomyces ophidiicola]
MGADDNSKNCPLDTYRYNEEPVYTTSQGCPVMDPESSQRIGENGPLLIQDFHLIDLLAHFDRERIPERVVHAKGAGAYGEFEVTDDISDITTIDMLKGVGKKTKLITRFSTVGGEKGSADSARDPRGFAMKFYTEEGNWDWVFNNTPIFFLRDPSKFPIFIHTQKRNPQTNLKDATMFWDYLSTHQEAVHQVMHLFSDRGTPYSYRHMNGYSGHTYKWIKPDGTFNYVQIHCKTDQGIKTFNNEEAHKMSAENPDWHTEDLFKSIENGEHPSWTCYVQVMSQEQAEKFRFSVFDLTKVWPQAEFPLRRFGRFTLNKNPQNYFAEIEQAAFSPSHMVPGSEPSADPVLQSRLFSYPDTHRHRLGTNYHQIPVNCPLRAFSPYQRDGAMVVNGNYGANPNYPSTFRRLQFNPVKASQEHEVWTGAVLSKQIPVTDEDYVQPNGLWEVLGRQPGQQDNFVHNVSVHLCNAQETVRERTYGMFKRVNQDLGGRIEKATETLAKQAQPRL